MGTEVTAQRMQEAAKEFSWAYGESCVITYCDQKGARPCHVGPTEMRLVLEKAFASESAKNPVFDPYTEHHSVIANLPAPYQVRSNSLMAPDKLVELRALLDPNLHWERVEEGDWVALQTKPAEPVARGGVWGGATLVGVVTRTCNGEHGVISVSSGQAFNNTHEIVDHIPKKQIGQRLGNVLPLEGTVPQHQLPRGWGY